MKLELKEIKKMQRSSIEFMAYNPSDYSQSGYSDDTIANGTTGQSKSKERSKLLSSVFITYSAKWNNIEYQTDGVFDGTTFTVPVNGFYYFQVVVCWHCDCYLNISM